MIKSPIPWFGGKQKLVNKLLPLIPRHTTYVEPFGGGAALLCAKEPSPVEIYNDIDGNLANFFRVLRDDGSFQELYEKIKSSPYSREEYYACRAYLRQFTDTKTPDVAEFIFDHGAPRDQRIERARCFFVVARQSFGGDFGRSWGTVVTRSRRGMAGTTSAYLNAIEGLPEIHGRLMQVQVERSDFRTLIPRYDTSDSFFFIDPPYLDETRRSHGYEHEMSRLDHEQLIDILSGPIKGKYILCGYPNDLYDQLYVNKLQWDVKCHAVGRTRQLDNQGEGAMDDEGRTECIWFNFEIDGVRP